MTRIALALVIVVGSMVARPSVVVGQSAQSDADLATGIRQVREGEFEAAVLTLDGVVRRLSGQKGRANERARAYTYLAIAYIGLAQEEKAHAQFLEAWKADRSFILSPKEFPPSIIEFSERVRKEGEAEGKAQAKVQAKAAPRPSSADKRHGSKLPLILGGGAVVAGGVALAVAAGGDGEPTLPPLSPAVTDLRTKDGGSFDIEYVSAQPAPGSTVTGVVNFVSTFKVRFVVRNPSSVDARGCYAYALLGGNDFCTQSITASAFNLVSGASLQVEVGTPQDHYCVAPIDIVKMRALTMCDTGPEAAEGYWENHHGAAERDWSINYRILP